MRITGTYLKQNLGKGGALEISIYNRYNLEHDSLIPATRLERFYFVQIRLLMCIIVVSSWKLLIPILELMSLGHMNGVVIPTLIINPIWLLI